MPILTLKTFICIPSIERCFIPSVKPFLLQQSLCDLPVSSSHLSGFPRGGWKSLLSLRLHSLLNSLSLYLLQGQKQQKQLAKDWNLQGTQYSASLGLMEFHGNISLSQSTHLAKMHGNAWKHWNILRLVVKITPNPLLILQVIVHQSHCLVFAVHLPWQDFIDAEPPLLHWAQSLHLIAGEHLKWFFHLPN